MSRYKAVLFDSGRVLNKPATGHWFITPNFWNFVNKEKFKAIDKTRVSIAFQKADEYIVSQKLIETREDEYKHFIRFYEIFSENLPELNLNNEDIAAIAKDLVYNDDKYVFFEDALHILEKLKKNYKLAIVSDAWPSLLDVYKKAELTSSFDSIIISSVLGTSKPAPEMYNAALNELGVEPSEAIFIDDSLKNCLGALSVGISAVLLCRDKKVFISNKIKAIGKEYKVINSLYEIEKLL